MLNIRTREFKRQGEKSSAKLECAKLSEVVQRARPSTIKAAMANEASKRFKDQSDMSVKKRCLKSMSLALGSSEKTLEVI